MNSAERNILDARLKAWALRFKAENKLHGLDYPNICPMFKPAIPTRGNCALASEEEFNPINNALVDMQKDNYIKAIHIKIHYLHEGSKEDKFKAYGLVINYPSISKSKYYRELDKAMTVLSRLI